MAGKRKKALADMPFKYDDGGRHTAGHRGIVQDCAVRSLAIVSGRPYGVVRSLFTVPNAVNWFTRLDPDVGIRPGTFSAAAEALGLKFYPSAGDGVPVSGRWIVYTPGHYRAVVGGVIHDTHSHGCGDPIIALYRVTAKK